MYCSDSYLTCLSIYPRGVLGLYRKSKVRPLTTLLTRISIRDYAYNNEAPVPITSSIPDHLPVSSPMLPGQWWGSSHNVYRLGKALLLFA